VEKLEKKGRIRKRKIKRKIEEKKKEKRQGRAIWNKNGK